MSMILGCFCKDKRNLRERKVVYFMRNKLLPERISSKLGIFKYHITASYGILLCVSRVYSLRGKRLKGKGKGISGAQEPREKGGYCPILTCFINLARVLAIFFLHWMTAFPAFHLCVLVLGKQWKNSARNRSRERASRSDLFDSYAFTHV